MTEQRNEKILWDAKFNERVATYWLLHGVVVLTVTIVGIPLVPVWWIVARAFGLRYLRTYRCILTNRSLKVAKGWLIRVEKTIPLDRITDLGIIQGLIMRWMGIEALSVETAGQSSTGALVKLTGIQDGRKFRDAVLAQRERVVGSEEDRQLRTTQDPAAAADDNAQLLQQIRDSLLRIEETLGRPDR